MSLSKPLLTAIFLLASLGNAFPQAAGADEPEQDPRISAPASLAGTADNLHHGALAPATNLISGGLGFTSVYTDNAELTPAGQVSDVSYRVEPQLSFQQTRTRTSVSLGGSLGFVANQHLHDRNQFSANASGDASYRFSELTTLRVSDTFLNTTGLFAEDQARVGDGIGILQRPNASTFTYAQVMSNSALAELSRQIGPSTIIGARGTQSMSWYPGAVQDPGFAPLYDSQSYGVETFYNRRLSPRNWAGLTVRARKFTVGGALGHTNAGSALVFYAFNASPTVSLTFFGGPELSATSLPRSAVDGTPIFERRMWSPAFGSAFSWLGRRTSATATFARQLSDGGGLASAVTLYSADAGIRRQIGARQEVEVNFGFSQNTPLVPTDSTRLYSGRVQFMRRVGNHCTVHMAYGRDQQGTAVGQRLANANQVSISFIYLFSHGLVR